MSKLPIQLLSWCLATLTLTVSLTLSVNAQTAGDTLPIWLFGAAQSLGSGNDGNTPLSAPIFDGTGNIYGTTQRGGTIGVGTVFKLSPTTSGLWHETILHNFKGGTADGSNPSSTLFIDIAGKLYGTTLAGGLKTSNPECSAGCGIIFKLTPTTTARWTMTVLHKFSGPDGTNPVAGLTADSAGNFYGTASGGGAGFGTVFKLSRTSTGWKLTTLYAFKGGMDGATPSAPLVFDAAGNLYGTTQGGGSKKLGTVFKLVPQITGVWKETVLHSFQGGNDGTNPTAPVVLDGSGNVYGTSEQIGTLLPCGTAFKLTAANGYAETVLHRFMGMANGGDACAPNGLIFDSSGSLFGTSLGGGTDNAGTIFKLTHLATGWEESIVHSFIGDTPGSNDGEFPLAPMSFGANGHLFGTAIGPGFPAGGEVFEFNP